MILLDTKVISEIMRARPDPTVRTWFRALPRREFWTASVVIAELFSGVDLMPAGRKQTELRGLVEAMIAEDLRGQILAFDLSAARQYGQILSYREEIGRPIKEMDALLAATAKAHGATMATRNIPDFEHCGIALVNPWQSA